MTMDRETFQIAFWIVSLLFAAFGMGITAYGWKVNGEKARALAAKKDLHDSIDRCLKALMEFEDTSCSFWLDKESEVRPYQITILHRRLISAFTQLVEMCPGILPSIELAALRRNATLDAETATRPVNDGDERIRKISRAVTNIMATDLLRKSWLESR